MGKFIIRFLDDPRFARKVEIWIYIIFGSTAVLWCGGLTYCYITGTLWSK